MDLQSNATKARYSSTLRDSQTQITQRRILEAMADLVSEDGADSVTHSTVAIRAQVAERTVYRHYPSKEALWDAFLHWVSQKVGIAQFPETEKDLLAGITEMYQNFEQHEKLVQNCLTQHAWSELWINGRNGWRASVEKVVDNAAPKASEENKAMAAAVTQLLFSGIAWKAMKDQWGFTSEQSANAAGYTVRQLFGALRRERPSNTAK